MWVYFASTLQARKRQLYARLLIILTVLTVVAFLLFIDEYHLQHALLGKSNLLKKNLTSDASMSRNSCYIRSVRATDAEQQSAATAGYKLIPSFRFMSRPSVSTTGIPRIIHQTWKQQGSVPVVYRKWMSTWSVTLACDDWEYWFWTNEDMRRFVAQIYPQHLAMYDSYAKDIYRADAFRYMLLYKYGGLYADLDMECMKSINTLIDQWDCGISEEPHEHAHFIWNGIPPLLSPALMICRPSHQFFSLVMENLKARLDAHCNTPFTCTGPDFLTYVYTQNINRTTDSAAASTAVDDASAADAAGVDDTATAPLRILSHTLFHPTLLARWKFLNQCSDTKLRSKRPQLHDILCERLRTVGYNRSSLLTAAYTDHHWSNIYEGFNSNQLREVFDISDLEGDINNNYRTHSTTSI